MSSNPVRPSWTSHNQQLHISLNNGVTGQDKRAGYVHLSSCVIQPTFILQDLHIISLWRLVNKRIWLNSLEDVCAKLNIVLWVEVLSKQLNTWMSTSGRLWQSSWLNITRDNINIQPGQTQSQSGWARSRNGFPGCIKHRSFSKRRSSSVAVCIMYRAWDHAKSCRHAALNQ